ncbi:hypothetical protein TKK_0001604 [Trichogramma kaykai]
MDSIRALYKELLNLYMNEEYIRETELSEIDPMNENLFKPLENIKINNEIEHACKTLLKSEKDLDRFKKEIRDFLKVLCDAFKDRYNFDDDCFTARKAFYPSNALSRLFHNQCQNLNHLIDQCPALIKDDKDVELINNQWNLLLETNIDDFIITQNDPVAFWISLEKYQNSSRTENINNYNDLENNNDYPFSRLSAFALDFMCLPESNALSERIWSKYKKEKGDRRGRLCDATMRGILLTASCVKDSNGLANFESSKEMIVCMLTNLNDPIADVRKIKDINEYMDEPLSEEYLKKCAVVEENYKAFKKNSRLNALFCYHEEEPINETFANEPISVDNPMIIEEQSAEQNQNDFEVEDLFIKKNNNILEINKNMITQFMASLKSAPSDIEKVIEETRKNYRKKDIFIPENKSALLKKQYYVGIFNAHFENYQVHLLVESFQTLVGEEWLDDNVVNAVECSIEKSWLWATFIPTTHSNLFFADEWEVEPSKDWPMFTRDFGIKHLIIIPYVHNGHWRIFMINLKNYTFTVIYLYDKKKKELMYQINWVQSRFERFLELCKKLGFRQSWTSVQWTIEFFEKRDRPFQASTDGSNCDNDSASSSSQSSISRGFSPLMSPIPSYNSNHRVYDSVQQYQNGRASNGGQLIRKFSDDDEEHPINDATTMADGTSTGGNKKQENGRSRFIRMNGNSEANEQINIAHIEKGTLIISQRACPYVTDARPSKPDVLEAFSDLKSWVKSELVFVQLFQ